MTQQTLTKFTVRVLGSPTIDVQADYYKIEQGALIFRVNNRGSYPIAVHTFAAGYWLEVTCG